MSDAYEVAFLVDIDRITEGFPRGERWRGCLAAGLRSPALATQEGRDAVAPGMRLHLSTLHGAASVRLLELPFMRWEEPVALTVLTDKPAIDLLGGLTMLRGARAQLVADLE